MLPTILKNPVIPKSLRQLPHWFCTGLVESGHEGRLTSKWYSPNTLGELHWDSPDDFSDYDLAAATASDHVWIDRIEFRIVRPYLGLVLPNGVDQRGLLAKWVKPFARVLGGYWEFRSNGCDILGILKTDVHVEPGFSNYRGHLVFAITDGRCEFTGQPLPTLGGDPETTNQTTVKEMIEEIRRGAPMLGAVMRQASVVQLELF